MCLGHTATKHTWDPTAILMTDHDEVIAHAGCTANGHPTSKHCTMVPCSTGQAQHGRVLLRGSVMRVKSMTTALCSASANHAHSGMKRTHTACTHIPPVVHLMSNGCAVRQSTHTGWPSFAGNDAQA
jgi:hypothetical protein